MRYPPRVNLRIACDRTTATGPGPAAPFVYLGLNASFQSPLAGMALSLVAVATTPQPPGTFDRPMEALLWPAFRDGDLSLNHQSSLEADSDPATLRDGSFPRAAWNLGEKMGLRRHASLVPLLGAWSVFGVAMLRGRRRPETLRDSPAAQVS